MRLTSRSFGTVTLVVLGSFALVARAGDGPKLGLDEVKKALDAKGAHEPFVPAAPTGIDAATLKAGIPENDPLTPAKVSLGKQLYFDGRLSADGKVSCASCHRPEHGWGDPRTFSEGVGGKLGGRHAPTVLNRVLGKVQFWDGRARTLEDQALGPIQNPVEMASKLDDVVKLLNANEVYRLQFERVFGGPATPDRIARAIAAFERTVVAAASRVDLADEAERYAKVDLEDEDVTPEVKERARAARATAAAHPLTDAEKRGRDLFSGKASCSLCHAGQNYADEDFHNIGVGSGKKEPDVGLSGISKKDEDWGKFKTPTVRGALARAPYMHDGSEPTLEAVVEYYDRGGTPNKNLSPRIKKLGLSAAEKADLVAFLKALSGDLPKVEAPRLP